MVTPYYQDSLVTLYHGDARDLLPLVADECAVMVTDPPFGMSFRSGRDGRHGDCAIAGDDDTTARDAVLGRWRPRPALVFGRWSIAKPIGTRMVLTWDKGEGQSGMGDLSLPWKPVTEEVYVLGSGFVGHRGSSVLSAPMAGLVNVREHPTEKPLRLMKALIRKCPPGAVFDPFAGSGTTLRAAKDLGRRAIGIEIEERYCEIAAKRMSQEVLFSDVGSAA